MLQIRDCKEGDGLRVETTMGFNSVCERARKCDKENREWWLRQTNPVNRWYLDLVVKRLSFGQTEII